MLAWVVIGMVALLPGLAAARDADITGTWLLDVARSDRPELPLTARGTQAAHVVVTAAERSVLTAQPSSAVVTIMFERQRVTGERRSGAGLERWRAVPLDGMPQPADITGLSERAWRDGAAVVMEHTTSVTLPEGRVTSTVTVDRFSLQADGTLAHERRVASGGRSQTWQFVYRRVQ